MPVKIDFVLLFENQSQQVVPLVGAIGRLGHFQKSLVPEHPGFGIRGIYLQQVGSQSRRPAGIALYRRVCQCKHPFSATKQRHQSPRLIDFIQGEVVHGVIDKAHQLGEALSHHPLPAMVVGLKFGVCRNGRGQMLVIKQLVSRAAGERVAEDLINQEGNGIPSGLHDCPNIVLPLQDSRVARHDVFRRHGQGGLHRVEHLIGIAADLEPGGLYRWENAMGRRVPAEQGSVLGEPNPQMLGDVALHGHNPQRYARDFQIHGLIHINSGWKAQGIVGFGNR